MKLVACPDCHAQYDVTTVAAERFTCRCGTTLENRALTAVDARIQRCASCGANVLESAASCDYCGAAVVREPGHLSLICPECFARNADAARFCTACGVAFRPEPVPAEGPALACPACESPMKSSHVADVALCECPQCHGLWVPGARLDELVRRATEARRAAAVPPAPRVHGGNPNSRPLRYRKCPECAAFMLRQNFRRSSGVVIDVCHQHGTWLDADEIEEIAGFILSGGQTSAALEDEHKNAEALAAAARLRCASEATMQRAIFGSSTTPRRTSLLGLLIDLLTS
ncbi:MAG TPA: zf-TFIIB domain-containing protein [Myxococcota bacterium]|nr:zf-TFIIB domain-containing protein [Myxococcota bacterium]